jgi:hypothetical protein
MKIGTLPQQTAGTGHVIQSAGFVGQNTGITQSYRIDRNPSHLPGLLLPLLSKAVLYQQNSQEQPDNIF